MKCKKGIWCAVLATALLLSLLGGCGQSGGFSYKNYDLVVTAWDTPSEVLEEVRQSGVKTLDYFDGDTLLMPDELSALGRSVSVYLCEGNYQAGDGGFILTDGSVELTVTGAGTDKTIITADGGLRENMGAAVEVQGSGKPVTLEGMTLQGFRYGVLVENSSSVTLRQLQLTGHHYAGIALRSAQDCVVENCVLESNGASGAGETGYGLSLDAACSNITGSGNTYRNNANGNILDYPAFWSSADQQGNTLALTMEYDLAGEEPILIDPVLDSLNARPGAQALRYEMEKGGLTGASTVEQGNMEAGSEGSYVFLFDGSITLKILVPEAGNYRLFVVGGSDDGNNKCDFVQVNGGEKYLTSYPGDGKGSWQLSQPGTEFWTNNVLMPQPPTEGFAFQAGENTVTISANWGYCAYDCIYLEKIPTA